MKKYIWAFMIAILAISMVSCNKENNEESKPVILQFVYTSDSHFGIYFSPLDRRFSGLNRGRKVENMPERADKNG